MSGSDDSSFDRTLGVQAYASGSAGLARRGRTHALPAGTRVGEFRIEQVLGEGGFGIVYLAMDLQLGRLVALKEYLPASMAGRGRDLSVALHSERDRETYEVGLRSFVNEARLLAQLDHPSLAKVHRFWEGRGTACMVMPYYQGQTLKQALQQQAAADGHAVPDEAWLRTLLDPLLDVLAYLHAQNVYHRDVSPENILLLPDGRPVLLDLGAARLIAGDATQNLTAILKQGYAPVEQYAESGAYKQGAWTDLYALAAVFYLAVAGRPPTPSVARLMNDDMPPAAQVGQGRFSHGLLAWIDACLAVQPEQRPRDVAAARLLLAQAGGEGAAGADGRHEASAPATALGVRVPDAPVAPLVRGGEHDPSARPSPTVRWRWAAAALVALSGGAAIVWFAAGLNTPPRAGSAEVRPAATPRPALPAAEPPMPALAPASAPSTEAATGPGAAAPTVPVGAAPSASPTAASAVNAPTDRPPSAVDGAPPRAAPAAAPAPTKPTAREPAAPRAEPHGGQAAQSAQCADLLQRLSLGEDTAALREKLATLRCR